MYRLLGKKSQSATDKTNRFLSAFISGQHCFCLSSKHNLRELVKPPLANHPLRGLQRAAGEPFPAARGVA
jgi:hypothetical protein